jgi:hypothetical protein
MKSTDTVTVRKIDLASHTDEALVLYVALLPDSFDVWKRT